MKVPNSFAQCSICKGEPPLSWEHVVPDSIGGTLKTDIQCERCNNTLGTHLVSQAKRDGAVRLAIRNLRPQLPELYDSIEEGQAYSVKNLAGDYVTARVKRGSMETRAEKKADGSLILDTKRGEKNIRKILSGDGLGVAETDDAIRRYRDAPSNKQVPLSPRTTAIRWDVESIFPDVGVKMDERLPVLMSYNFLCLLLGDAILHPQLDVVRDFIRGGQRPGSVEIISLRRKQYRPFHELSPRQQKDGLVIRLSLFHWDSLRSSFSRC